MIRLSDCREMMLLYLASDWSKPSLSVSLLAAISILCSSATPWDYQTEARNWLWGIIEMRVGCSPTRTLILCWISPLEEGLMCHTRDPMGHEGGEFWLLIGQWAATLDSDWLRTYLLSGSFVEKGNTFEYILIKHCLLSSVVMCEVWMTSLIEDVSVHTPCCVTRGGGYWPLIGH